MQSPTPPTASSAPASSSDSASLVGACTYPASRLAVFLAIVIIGTSADLLTKHWISGRLGMPFVEQGVRQPPIWLLDEVFGFDTSLNEGALFGIGQGHVVAFALLSVFAALGIVFWLFVARAAADLWLTVALSLVMGGILGNLYDRVGLPGLTWGPHLRHHTAGEPVYAVRDWLHFKIDALHFDWPIFNLADCLLVCGAMLLVWHTFRASH